MSHVIDPYERGGLRGYIMNLFGIFGKVSSIYGNTQNRS